MRFACLLLLLNACISRADFIVPTLSTYGWDRPTTPTPLSTFQAWERFLGGTTGPNAPQTVFGSGSGNPSLVTTGAANNFLGFGGPAGATWPTFNTTGIHNVFDSGAPSNGAFITGGGNIYSLGGVVQPTILIGSNVDGVPGNLDGGVTSILLQMRTQGTQLDPNSVRIFNPVTGQNVLPESSTILASAVLGGFGGTLTDWLFTFRLDGNADAYLIRSSAATSSMSLDRVAVDTHFTAAPAPPTILLLALAPVLALWRYGRGWK